LANKKRTSIYIVELINYTAFSGEFDMRQLTVTSALDLVSPNRRYASQVKKEAYWPIGTAVAPQKNKLIPEKPKIVNAAAGAPKETFHVRPTTIDLAALGPNNVIGPHLNLQRLQQYKTQLEQIRNQVTQTQQRAQQKLLQIEEQIPQINQYIQQKTTPRTTPQESTGEPAGWAQRAGDWLGRKMKAPGRALKDFGRGFRGAENDHPILTAHQGSAAYLFDN